MKTVYFFFVLCYDKNRNFTLKDALQYDNCPLG